jgi:hypothetical protein
MFFQKDYVLRMIEMMGDFMRRIGEMLDDMHRLRLLDDACREHCGMDLNAAGKLSVESIIDLLAPQPRLMMAEILYIQAMQTSLPDETREQLLYRCARLLLSLREESLLCELRWERLNDCITEVGPLFTPRDWMDTAAFFIQAEQFGLGEDQLYESLDEASLEEYPQLLAEGQKLMEGCLNLPKSRLEAGGLPYPEVLESINTLKKRREALYTA